MPTDILQATMENLDPSDLNARIDAIGATNEFLSTYEPGKKHKVYICTVNLV